MDLSGQNSIVGRMVVLYDDLFNPTPGAPANILAFGIIGVQSVSPDLRNLATSAYQSGKLSAVFVDSSKKPLSGYAEVIPDAPKAIAKVTNTIVRLSGLDPFTQYRINVHEFGDARGYQSTIGQSLGPLGTFTTNSDGSVDTIISEKISYFSPAFNSTGRSLCLVKSTDVNSCLGIGILGLVPGKSGCTDSRAINYDPEAFFTSNKCLYAEKEINESGGSLRAPSFVINFPPKAVSSPIVISIAEGIVPLELRPPKPDSNIITPVYKLQPSGAKFLAYAQTSFVVTLDSTFPDGKTVDLYVSSDDKTWVKAFNSTFLLTSSRSGIASGSLNHFSLITGFLVEKDVIVPTEPPKSSSDELSTTAIAFIAVCSVVGLLLFGSIVWFIMNRRRSYKYLDDERLAPVRDTYESRTGSEPRSSYVLVA